MADRDLPDLIERLSVAAAECRAAVREGHEATKDLRAATKEAERVLGSDPVRDQIDAEVTATLKAFNQEAQAHVDKTAKAIDEKFVRFVKPLFDELERISELQRLAEPIYAQFAELVISSGRLDPQGKRFLELLAKRPRVEP